MRRLGLLTSTALGIVVGAVLFNSPDAKAILGLGDIVSDPGLYQVMGTVQGAIVEVIGTMQDALVNKFTDVGNLLGDKLTAGFSQNANYARAQIGAQEQIQDASNTAMATYQRSIRNAQIVADHVVTPAACLALDGGQSVSVSGLQADKFSRSVAAITDPRGEGGPSTPAWEGAGQAAMANVQQHLTRYCSAADVQAGLCSAVSPLENADQRADSFIGTPTYADQGTINAANDYITTLLQPVPPGVLRGDPRKSLAGLQEEEDRRNYNATMSLARKVATDIFASHAPTVQLTQEQQQQAQAEGRPGVQTASWSDALGLEVTRRYGNQAWAVSLEQMPSAPVILREVAREQALGNYIAWKSYQRLDQIAALGAAQLAATAAARFQQARTPTMPIPQVASQ